MFFDWKIVKIMVGLLQDALMIVLIEITFLLQVFVLEIKADPTSQENGLHSKEQYGA